MLCLTPALSCLNPSPYRRENQVSKRPIAHGHKVSTLGFDLNPGVLNPRVWPVHTPTLWFIRDKFELLLGNLRGRQKQSQSFRRDEGQSTGCPFRGSSSTFKTPGSMNHCFFLLFIWPWAVPPPPHPTLCSAFSQAQVILFLEADNIPSVTHLSV